MLWRNDGPGSRGEWRFTDISRSSGAEVRMDGMGLAMGDYDLDGYLDLFMTNVNDNVLLKNAGDGLRFTNVAAEAGAEIGLIGRRPRIAWGAMFLDYDNDGDEDLYVVSGFLDAPGAINSREQPNALLRNEGDGTFLDVSAGSEADDEGIGRGGAYLDFNKGRLPRHRCRQLRPEGRAAPECVRVGRPLARRRHAGHHEQPRRHRRQDNGGRRR